MVCITLNFTFWKMLMKFGFIKYFLLAILLLVGGGFGYLVFADVPVQQQEIVVDVPIANAQ